MLMRDWLGYVLMAKRGSADEGGGTATATEGGVDIVRGSGEYDAVDPGYSVEDKPATPDDKPAESTDETAGAPPAAEAGEEDSGGTPTDEAAGDAEKPSDEEEVELPSDDLLDRAAALGYGVEDILKFRSPASLERDIERAEQIAARLAQRKQAKVPEKVAEKPEPPKEPDWAAMKAEGYDERQLDIMKQEWLRSSEAHQKAMEAHEQIEQLKEKTKQLEQEREQEAWLAKTQRFETNVAALVKENKGYKALLGEGSAEEFKKSSKEFQNRNRLLRRQLTIEAEYRNAGMPVPSEERVLQEAAGSLFNGHIQQVARQKLKEDIKEAGEQALSRPQSAGKKASTGRQRAEERMEEYARTHNW